MGLLNTVLSALELAPDQAAILEDYISILKRHQDPEHFKKIQVVKAVARGELAPGTDGARQASCILNREGIIRWACDEMHRFYYADLTGVHLFNLVPPDRFQATYHAMKKLEQGANITGLKITAPYGRFHVTLARRTHHILAVRSRGSIEPLNKCAD